MVGEKIGDLLDEAIGAMTSEPDGDDDVALSSAQADHPSLLDGPAPRAGRAEVDLGHDGDGVFPLALAVGPGPTGVAAVATGPAGRRRGDGLAAAGPGTGRWWGFVSQRNHHDRPRRTGGPSPAGAGLAPTTGFWRRR